MSVWKQIVSWHGEYCGATSSTGQKLHDWKRVHHMFLFWSWGQWWCGCLKRSGALCMECMDCIIKIFRQSLTFANQGFIIATLEVRFKTILWFYRSFRQFCRLIERLKTGQLERLRLGLEKSLNLFWLKPLHFFSLRVGWGVKSIGLNSEIYGILFLLKIMRDNSYSERWFCTANCQDNWSFVKWSENFVDKLYP
jgi:hypothetical protein